MIHVALYQPAIPPNTGNIARQCVGMNAKLHVIGPIVFDISDHSAKRAGLDYWKDLNYQYHDSPEDFLNWLGSRAPWLITKFGPSRFDQPPYADEDILIFGNENTGLPEAWHKKWAQRRVYIPMPGKVRSYNLSNACAIVLAHAHAKAELF